MHSIPALLQFEHGFLLLHRTFLRRQVTQLREFSCFCVGCARPLGLELSGTVELPEKLL